MNFNRSEFTKQVIEKIPNEATRNAIFDLLDWSINQSLKNPSVKIEGVQNNISFHYVVDTIMGSAKLFYCYASGEVNIALGNFTALNSNAKRRFVNKLCALGDGFKYIARLIDNEPKARELFLVEETLVDPYIMKTFKEAIEDIQMEIPKSLF